MKDLLNEIDHPKDVKKLSENDIKQLANEIRNFLIDHISKTGGHLASNLGIVELTLSLIRNFDFPKDKIVFDVGHQSYVYKILTGRKDQFSSLRQYKGLSGFPKREESPYDFFDTGHSSNSISACLGMARARDLKKKSYEVIAVIGDGALTGGMTYEAFDDIGDHKTKIIIILNDNGMSISSNVGGISQYLNKLRLDPFYNKMKKKVHMRLDKKRSNKLSGVIHRIKDSFKSLFLPSMFFEDLGLRYIGPIDGHNLKALDEVLKRVKELDEPVVVHVRTKKGKGYSFAEETPDNYHAVSPFNIETGIKKEKNLKTYSASFGKALTELAHEDRRIVAITAAMKEGTGLSEFYDKYPKRFFDVGIAEEHATTFASGLATCGLKPVFAVYSTFLQRGFDQIIHDVCMQKQPVIFAIDRAGLVGNDGETHQGIFDLSYLNMIPNMIILSPKSIEEMKPMLEYAIHQNGPVAIRYPRGTDEISLPPLRKIVSYQWDIVKEGEKLAIIAVGKMTQQVVKALKYTKEEIKPMVIHASFIKPLDEKLLKELTEKNYHIMTIEDNMIQGGFGSSVVLKLQELENTKSVKVLGYQDHFISHGNINDLLKQEHLDEQSLAKQITKFYPS